MADAPTKKNAYLEPKAGISTVDGWWTQIDVGFKPLPNLSLYGYGRATAREKEVGAGVRYEFDLF